MFRHTKSYPKQRQLTYIEVLLKQSNNFSFKITLCIVTNSNVNIVQKIASLTFVLFQVCI